MKVSFLGIFGQGNLGNESTLQAILYHLRQRLPDAEVNCICTGPNETTATHNISAVPMRGIFVRPEFLRGHPLTRLLRKLIIGIPSELYRWFVAFKILKDRDMLILPGTGILTDGYTGPFGWPYEIFKWSLMSLCRRCKLLYVSVGAGPIFHPLSRWLIKSALSLADFRSYRDNFTIEYLQSIGFSRNNDRVYPDLAFSLPQALIPVSDDHSSHKTVIGIGLMSYAGELSTKNRSGSVYLAYINNLTKFVSWLLQQGYVVRFLIGNVLYDYRVTQDMLGLLQKHRVQYTEEQIIAEPISSVGQLLSQIAATDLVISPRYHNILFALMLNKPAISLSYHEKNDFLMVAMGLSKFCQNIEDFSVDRLTEQLRTLEKDSASLLPLIKRKTAAFRRALDEQYTLIFNDFVNKK